MNLCLKVPLLLSMCAVSPLTCLDSCESSSRLTINSVLAASNEVFIIMIYFMVTPISFVRFYLTRSGMVCLSIGFILSSPKYKISRVNYHLQRPFHQKTKTATTTLTCAHTKRVVHEGVRPPLLPATTKTNIHHCHNQQWTTS